jgi:hypothetical protein
MGRTACLRVCLDATGDRCPPSPQLPMLVRNKGREAMATYTNKLVRISLSGGLIGLVTTNPRRAIDNANR